MEKPILLLGDTRLYQRSQEVRPEELRSLGALVEDLHDTQLAYRRRHGHGQGLAAPQIGVPKRLIYFDIRSPIVTVNPILLFPEKEKIRLREHCLSCPGLVVEVERYRLCLLRYRNMDWQPREVLLQEEMAATVQHAIDHLDGVMPTMRAVDNKAFYMGGEKPADARGKRPPKN